MFLKPKNTALLPKALVFKRYTHIETSYTGATIYKTKQVDANDIYDPQYWVWDKEQYAFANVTALVLDRNNPLTGNIIEIGGNPVLDRTLVYTDKTHWALFLYDYNQSSLNTVDEPPFKWRLLGSNELPLPADQTNNPYLVSSSIVVYQKHVYYYHSSFDYMIKGEKEGTKIQYIKGNVIPLNSFNIRYYNDDIDLKEDDLIVIDGKLYSVEDPSTDKKYSPKPYNIYYATLNSIL